VDPFPQDVKQFLDANIESVEQLEILRLLGENPEKEWNSTTLAQEAQTQAKTIASQLTHLQARCLLTTMLRGKEVFCRYGPSTPEIETRLQHLLQVYQQRPVTMINLVYARAQAALRTFADAFRLRKEG
jgi:hypothetical protein